MPAPHPVPATLAQVGFTTHEADALGVTRWQRRRSRYRKLSRGVYEVVRVSAEEPSEALRARARPVLELTSDGVLSHASAGLLWNFRLPPRLRTGHPMHVTRTDGGVPPRRTGVVGHRAALSPAEVAEHRGLRVTDPVRTLLDLAPALTPVELVVCVDGVVCEHRHGLRGGIPPLVPRDQLLRSLGRCRGRRGVRRLRQAVELSVPGSDSAPETRLRLTLQEHGIADLTLDHRIVAPDGTEVLPDIAVEPARVSVQYEGAHHDRAGQLEIDIRRLRRTEAAGWTEVRITHRDLVERAGTAGGSVPRAVALVRAAMHR